MKKGIKAIIFDIGGVLELTSSSTDEKHRSIGVHEYMARKLKVSLDQYFDSIERPYTQSFEGKISREIVIKKLAKNLNSTPKRIKKLYTKAYRKNFKHNKKLYQFAFKLKKQGYIIAILSDQWVLSKEAIMIKKYIDNFDVVITSCDVGIRKPKPEIYKLVLKKLKIPVRQIIFIDNQKWNLPPAKKLGIKTILFKNNKQFFQEFKKFKLNV